MKLIEKILALGILISLVLKFNLITGGDFLLFSLTLILSCLYFPLGVLFFSQIRLRNNFNSDAYKEVTATRIILAIVAGIGCSAVCIGSLYKLMPFFGGNDMLMAGLPVIALTVVMTFVTTFRSSKPYGKFILIRATSIGGVGLMLLFISELQVIKFQYRNHPQYIEAYAQYLSDPANPDFERRIILEHKRAILTKEEFELYQKSMDR